MHMTNSCSCTYAFLHFRKISVEWAGVGWAPNKFFCISPLTLLIQLTLAKNKAARQHSSQHIEKEVKFQFLMNINDKPKVEFIKHFSRPGPTRPLCKCTTNHKVIKSGTGNFQCAYHSNHGTMRPRTL